MGTNYYVRKDRCVTCGHQEEQTHIGKSSAGWRFCFDPHFRTADQWREHLANREIVDEYGRPATHSEFWEMVEGKQSLKVHTQDYPTDFYVDPAGYDFSTREGFS